MLDSIAFGVYVLPFFSAYVAEHYWGRFKTIKRSIIITLIGHMTLVLSAISPVVVRPDVALPCFIVGILIICVGIGGFKANISSLVAAQCKFCLLRI